MGEDTVVIKNLPAAISHDDKIELLNHFGAIEVKIIGAPNKRNLVFAKYKNNRDADIAVKKLHNLIIMDHRISAEISRKSYSDNGGILNTNQTTRDCDLVEYGIEKAKSEFLDKMKNSMKNYDFSEPPPPNFNYKFPEPSSSVLENISKAMANTPDFYYQVLHLMNKLNFPCPFLDNHEEECAIFKRKNEIDNYREPIPESEIGTGDNTLQKINPGKRSKASKTSHTRPKLPQDSSNQTTEFSLCPNEVFDHCSPKSTLELEIPQNLSSIPKKDNDDPDNDYLVISKDQLAANQISQTDQRLIPAFKNYQTGKPSCRLYIKNLAKDIVLKDLHFIFRRYFRPELDQEQGSTFDIRLMQKGRMKGQAFVTLQSIELAQIALMETNGYILKYKPMVVQFARSAHI